MREYTFWCSVERVGVRVAWNLQTCTYSSCFLPILMMNKRDSLKKRGYMSAAVQDLCRPPLGRALQVSETGARREKTVLADWGCVNHPNPCH